MNARLLRRHARKSSFSGGRHCQLAHAAAGQSPPFDALAKCGQESQAPCEQQGKVQLSVHKLLSIDGDWLIASFA